MNWAAWTFVALNVGGLLLSIALDGKPRGPHSWRDTLVGFCIVMTLLQFAGFFE